MHIYRNLAVAVRNILFFFHIYFIAYGAMGMARDEFEPDSASSQFFWLLFESDLTPAGKNLLDGR
jgi:cyclophilin family peptidyl-prolyl cis-trans isomerase